MSGILGDQSMKNEKTSILKLKMYDSLLGKYCCWQLPYILITNEVQSSLRIHDDLFLLLVSLYRNYASVGDCQPVIILLATFLESYDP